uniref:Reverse transcriptase zinc-binding domain-containing protein n=1 Tax=Quercus lobata TaxID=97700 RepID=A0A7N2MHA8_QUELO
MNKIAGTIHAQNREGPPLDSRKGPQGSSDQVRGAHSQKWQHGGALNLLFRHKLLLGATPCSAHGVGSPRGSWPQAGSPRPDLGAYIRKTNKYKKTNLISFGQNQGLAWSSDSNLWGNQVQEMKIKSFGQNQEPRSCMVHGLKPVGKPSPKNKSHKLWTEPRSCMVLELKPMGKPSTRDENQKLWTEPRSCMVHGLKPVGKPSTKKQISQALDRTKVLHGPRTQACGGNQSTKNKSHKLWTEPRSCMVLGLKPMGKPSTRDENQKLWTEPRSCMVLGLKPVGKPSTKNKSHKLWTEPRSCMVLGLKPMGKPSTRDENQKLWTEPRSCMVHGLKPVGKPSTKNKSHKLWTEPRSCMVLGLKPMGKPSTRDENQKLWTEPRSCMIHGLKPVGKPSTKNKSHKLWTEPRSCMVLGLKPMGKPSTRDENQKLWTEPSLLQTRDLIREGSIWQVGDGEQIGIESHKWLPRPPCFRPRVDKSLKVSSLLNATTRQWDRAKIQSLFHDSTRSDIFHLKLGPPGSRDKLCWNENKSKTFSVKTAYQIAVKLLNPPSGEHSNARQDVRMWKTFWSLNTPPKVRNFLWRASSDILPTRVNLLRRKIQVDPRCTLCGQHDETTTHILWDCPYAQNVWALVRGKLQKSRSGVLSFYELAQMMMTRLTTSELETWAMVSWSIWNARNKFHFEQNHERGGADLRDLHCEGELLEI